MNKQGEMQIPFNLLIVLGKHINTSFHLITNICKFKMSVSLSNKGKKTSPTTLVSFYSESYFPVEKYFFIGK